MRAPAGLTGCMQERFSGNLEKYKDGSSEDAGKSPNKQVKWK